ncbi:MAG: hypothetical protein RL448_518, partial [Actinomycetota bacterium]
DETNAKWWHAKYSRNGCDAEFAENFKNAAEPKQSEEEISLRKSRKTSPRRGALSADFALWDFAGRIGHLSADPLAALDKYKKCNLFNCCAPTAAVNEERIN